MKHYIFLLSLIIAMPLQAGQMYKWTDAKGDTHYTQTPPPQTAETSEYLAPPPAADFGNPKETEAPEKPNATGANAEKTDKKPNNQQEQDAANCETARRNLQVFSENPRVGIKSPDGKVTELDEAQRQARIARAQKDIDYFCKDGNANK